MKWLIQWIILKKILSTTEGRDKICKLFQYTAKIALWLKYTQSEKAKLLTAHMSLTRKIIRLAHGLEPLVESFDLPPLSTTNNILTALNTSLSLASDLADDVICLGKMKLIHSTWIDRATPISDRCWFGTIWLDLIENIRSTDALIQKRNLAKKSDHSDQVQTLDDKIFIHRASFVKLLADLIFCSVDVLHLGDRVSPGWQNISGMVSASIGTFKLYKKFST